MIYSCSFCYNGESINRQSMHFVINSSSCALWSHSKILRFTIFVFVYTVITHEFWNWLCVFKQKSRIVDLSWRGRWPSFTKNLYSALVSHGPLSYYSCLEPKFGSTYNYKQWLQNCWPSLLFRLIKTYNI